MRFRSRLAVSVAAVVALAAVMPAADPQPQLKEVKPAGGPLRVRIPVKPGFPESMSFVAQVPNGKKKSELVDAKVAFEVMPERSYVTAKKLESWGYEPGKAKDFVLPELHVPTSQVWPKAAGGGDAVVKLKDIKLTVIGPEAASKDGTVFQSDLCLSSTTLMQAVSPGEFRLSFADKFIEVTVPAASATRRPGADALAIPVTVSPDAKLVPSVAATVSRTIPSENPARVRATPVFTYAALDGQDTYTLPDGKTKLPVSVAVSTISNMPSGVMVTLGLARGVKMEFDAAAAGLAGMGVDLKTAFVPGKAKELRIGLTVEGEKGKKEQRDIVIKDVEVQVDKNISEGYILVGQKFMDTYFADAVYNFTGPSDGWKLYGRTNPDLLADVKTRPLLRPRTQFPLTSIE